MGVAGDVFEGVDAAQAGFDGGVAEAFEGFGEPVRDLAAVREPVGAAVWSRPS
jgi:hypothetical protein